jgi:hypothetical protein
VQQFDEIDHIAPNILFVIPGRRSQRVRPLAGPMTGSAQANPESSNQRR